MFTWQYIDIPQHEIETIQKEFRDNLPVNDLFFQQVSIKTKYVLGFELAHTVLIQIPPININFPSKKGMTIKMPIVDKNDGIHMDVPFFPNERYAINIPLENCANSVTRFWKTNTNYLNDNTQNGHPYQGFDVKDCELISEVRLTRPVLFDTLVPHNVFSPQTVWRRAISLRFKDDISHLIK